MNQYIQKIILNNKKINPQRSFKNEIYYGEKRDLKKGVNPRLYLVNAG